MVEGQAITAEQIDELLRFLPLLDIPGRDCYGASGGLENTGDGAITFPYPIYPEDVLQFYAAAGQSCWSDYTYHPAEAARRVHDDAFIARATLDELRTMLTYCVRGERFSEGHWGAMLESGRVVAILKRLRVLREQIR